MKSRFVSILGAFVLVLGAGTQLLAQQEAKQETKQELPPIRNFLKINDQFCTGAQPRLEHLAKLKADGVKAIINLRQPSEHRAEEEEVDRTTNVCTWPCARRSLTCKRSRAFQTHLRSWAIPTAVACR